MAALNIQALLAEGEVIVEVGTEFTIDKTLIQADQPASASGPVSLFGHAGTLTLAWTPTTPAPAPAPAT